MSFLRELSSRYPIPIEELRLTDSQKSGQQIIEGALGEIKGVDVLTGGLVHYVYRVQGEKQSGIVKLRGVNFSALPEIQTDPNNIMYEHRALQLLSGIEPTVFPHVLGYSEDEHFILMTDVLPSRRTLEADLEDKTANLSFVTELGRTVARVHKKLEPFQEQWRDTGDDDSFKQDIYYRLGYHNNPVLNETVRQAIDSPRQFVLADLSPKNIGRNADGGVSICDLDAFCRGNVEYAISFLPGHLLLHNLTDFDTAYTLVTSVIEGFSDELPNIDYDSMFFKRLAIGAILYRIQNKAIPYNVSYTDETKSAKSQTALRLLDQKDFSWKTLVSEMTAS